MHRIKGMTKRSQFYNLKEDEQLYQDTLEAGVFTSTWICVLEMGRSKDWRLSQTWWVGFIGYKHLAICCNQTHQKALVMWIRARKQSPPLNVELSFFCPGNCSALLPILYVCNRHRPRYVVISKITICWDGAWQKHITSYNKQCNNRVVMPFTQPSKVWQVLHVTVEHTAQSHPTQQQVPNTVWQRWCVLVTSVSPVVPLSLKEFVVSIDSHRWHSIRSVS